MDRPLSISEFKQLLDPLLAPLGLGARARLVVGVSGGGDSMALLRLAAAAYPGRIAAVTVDHGLRPDSVDEARQVGVWAAAIGVPHRIVFWQGPKPSAGLQAAARAARYALLVQQAEQWGEGGNAAPLLVAHTEDDQAETFLMRLARGSGMRGLGGMRAAAEIAGAPPVPLLRPLLGVPRAHLRATLIAFGQAWIDEPSNVDAHYERVRWRARRDDLYTDGLAGPSLARMAGAFARLSAHREEAAWRALAAHGRLYPEGAWSLPADFFARLPPALAAGALDAVLASLAPGLYPPPQAARARALERLAAGAPGFTLGGCRFAPGRGGWWVGRERRRAPPPVLPLVPGRLGLWDGRFLVSLPADWPGGAWAAGPAEQAPGGPGPAWVRARLPALRRDGAAAGGFHLAAGAAEWRALAGVPRALFVGDALGRGIFCRFWQAEIAANSHEILAMTS